ncbi:MAG: hypothetical protein KBS81_00695, partial [Spirochaetales bacterium]|nr:hypothetical protein [Candidatus Physcosoma equi]
SAQFSLSPEGEVILNNRILPTPVITFDTKEGENDTLVVSATVKKMTADSYTWIIGGEIQESSDTYSDLVIENWSSYKYGLSVQLYVTDRRTGVVWAEETIINKMVDEACGYYVAKSQDGRYCFFEVTPSTITYSVGDSMFNTYEPQPYRVQNENLGVRLIWKNDPEDTREMAFFIPYVADGSGAVNYEWDEFGAENDMEMSLEKLPEAPVFTPGSPLMVSSEFHRNTVLWRDQIWTIQGKGRHDEKGVNGTCSVCGYDKTIQYYGIYADSRYVEARPGKILLTRYWPGELTLADGSVVENADHFYVGKNEKYSVSGFYELFIPAEIYDVYEAAGGYASIDNAFDWYLAKYYPELSLEYWRIDNAKAFVDVLLGEDKYFTPVAEVSDNIHAGGRETVTNDFSAVQGMDLKHFSTGAYNKNSLQLDAETPITEQNGFYYSIRENKGELWAVIYYPEEVQRVYEKARGFNPSSGNPFHAYMEIYYPEVPAVPSNAQQVLEALFTNDYKVPEKADFLLYASAK